MRRSTLTVGRYLEFLGASERIVEWPPDVFAVVVSLLQKSGGYTRAISDWWPPVDRSSDVPVPEQARRWADRMKQIGLAWRNGAMSAPRTTPDVVIDWWRTVVNASSNITDLRYDDDVCSALLQLCAVADEASSGVGISPIADDFETEAWLMLDDRGTLCAYIDPAMLRVLPKCHTPKVGMTVRSLSHHLSLVSSGDVEPHWYIFAPRKETPGSEPARSLNLLLVPQPRMVVPANFQERKGPLQNLDPEFGFFTCDLHGRVNLDHVVALYDRARGLVPSVDGVILPELSLSESEYEQLRRLIVQDRKSMLVAGVGNAARDGHFGDNYVRIDVPIDIGATGGDDDRAFIEPQRKHHRWLLDGGQIKQYGLSTSLNPAKKLWECIDISERELAFVAMERWLTLSVLICEDLARQDPVAELIRSVGPNLVVALLADGPQLAARWPARYATVLADDPGSSVLTLTSAGMVDLCRGPRRMLEARPVALWKDPLTGGPYELNLPSDADALLLSLGVERRVEWTADGRSDAVNGEGTTSYLTMLCVHPIAVPQMPPPAPPPAR